MAASGGRLTRTSVGAAPFGDEVVCKSFVEVVAQVANQLSAAGDARRLEHSISRALRGYRFPLSCCGQ